MGEPKVVKSREAQADFNRIYAWIAQDSGEARAEAVIMRLDAALLRLAKRPGLGRRRRDFRGDPHGLTVAPWLVVYDPLPDDAGILVLRIVDTRRDVAALLGKKS
ncbi:type II toxin-antitoxin system RelE/ParE family toxin [Caulobacter sp. DWR2-3-1b2]|uniref:type II toxin-antitoxin system RelE/ParE family toxin n=1 Tax=unclassified Caulobacter TaxID=2648921 RepID=UPI0019CE224A|nr:type II toxin-antitoxin system RelE/ParE family toxin [Caulobacter sp.]